MTHSKLLAVSLAASVAAIGLLYWLCPKPKAIAQRDPPHRQIGFRAAYNDTAKLRRMLHSATA
jgi:hypothetical protein